MFTIRNPTSPTRIAVSATRPAALYSRTIVGCSAIQNRGRLDRDCISMVPYHSGLGGRQLGMRASMRHRGRGFTDADLGGGRVAGRLARLERSGLVIAG